MKVFLVAAFFVAVVFGYILVGPDQFRAMRALGVALGLTFIGWLVARKKTRSLSAGVMGVLMAVAWIGRN